MIYTVDTASSARQIEQAKAIGHFHSELHNVKHRLCNDRDEVIALCLDEHVARRLVHTDLALSSLANLAQELLAERDALKAFVNELGEPVPKPETPAVCDPSPLPHNNQLPHNNHSAKWFNSDCSDSSTTRCSPAADAANGRAV